MTGIFLPNYNICKASPKNFGLITMPWSPFSCDLKTIVVHLPLSGEKLSCKRKEGNASQLNWEIPSNILSRKTSVKI